MWGRQAAAGRGAFDEPSQRAQVAELTASVDLSRWPERTRFIARREPLYPGAQRTLFDSELWRYRGFCTDVNGDPAEFDAHMRAHARIENNPRHPATRRVPNPRTPRPKII